MNFKIIISFILFFLILSCKKDDINNNQGNQKDDKTTAVFNPNITYGSLTDQDGNIYKTVKIGTQTWMAENLKTTKYRDGTMIPNFSEYNDWHGNYTTGAYCNYDNDEKNVATYGRLYNLFAVSDIRNIAPVGWHVPSDKEWTTLITYLGGASKAGIKLREIGTSHWKIQLDEATNESGFTALPGGSRDYDGYFQYIYNIGTWWSKTPGRAVTGLCRSISCNTGYEVTSEDNFGTMGFSIRCLKD